MSALLQFLNQDEYLKGINVYESIIKAYASYVEDKSTGSSRDELWGRSVSTHTPSLRPYMFLEFLGVKHIFENSKILGDACINNRWIDSYYNQVRNWPWFLPCAFPVPPHFELRLSIMFCLMFYIFNWNEMFWFWSVLICYFGVVL